MISKVTVESSDWNITRALLAFEAVLDGKIKHWHDVPFLIVALRVWLTDAIRGRCEAENKIEYIGSLNGWSSGEIDLVREFVRVAERAESEQRGKGEEND
jgi:hypothetical protein